MFFHSLIAHLELNKRFRINRLKVQKYVYERIPIEKVPHYIPLSVLLS